MVASSSRAHDATDVEMAEGPARSASVDSALSPSGSRASAHLESLASAPPRPMDADTGGDSGEREGGEPGERECRICFEGPGPDGDVISPCECRGRLDLFHYKCLKKWCQERGVARCEICGKDFDGGVKDRLAKAVERAQRRQRQQEERETERILMAHQALQGVRIIQRNGEVIVYWDFGGSTYQPTPVQQQQQQQQQRRASCRSLLILLAAVAVLYTITYVYAANTLRMYGWLDITFKVIAFIVPIYVVIRAVQILHMRRVARARTEPGDPERPAPPEVAAARQGSGAGTASGEQRPAAEEGDVEMGLGSGPTSGAEARAPEDAEGGAAARPLPA